MDTWTSRSKTVCKVKHWCLALRSARWSRSSQRCWMGFRSKLCAGRSSFSTQTWENHFSNGHRHVETQTLTLKCNWTYSLRPSVWKFESLFVSQYDLFTLHYKCHSLFHVGGEKLTDRGVRWSVEILKWSDDFRGNLVSLLERWSHSNTQRKWHLDVVLRLDREHVPRLLTFEFTD